MRLHPSRRRASSPPHRVAAGAGWLAVAFMAWLGTACAHHVDVEVPAVPAVALPDDAVAIVTMDRGCAPVADALVDEVNRLPGLRVDPKASTMLQVFGCELALEPQIDVRQQVDARSGITRQSRDVTVEGRAHAVVAVVQHHVPQAHLIGTGRHEAAADAQAHNLRSMSRTARQKLVAAVARDLSDQIRPMPRLTQRRFYPSAAEGTARRLHNLAVQAELTGDYREAHRLAEAAWQAAPTARSRAYVDELASLVERAPSSR